MRGTWGWPGVEAWLPASGRHYRSASTHGVDLPSNSTHGVDLPSNSTHGVDLPSNSTRGGDLLQLQAGVAGEFAGAQQQAVDHIGIELLAGTALLSCDFGGVQ